MNDLELVRRIREAQALIRRTKNHRYQVFEAERWSYVLGVTSVIKMLDKPQLLGWAARLGAETGDPKAHEKRRDEAADMGKSLHAAIERECRLMMGEPGGEGFQLTEDEAMALSRWRQWAGAAEFRPLAAEFFLHHREHGYAGQPDALGYVRPLLRDGKRGEPILAVFDWKTGGKALYAEHHLQSVPYRVGLSAMVDCDVPAGYLVHVPRDGDRLSEKRATDNVAQSMRAFLGLKEAYLWKREIEREMEAA